MPDQPPSPSQPTAMGPYSEGKVLQSIVPSGNGVLRPVPPETPEADAAGAEDAGAGAADEAGAEEGATGAGAGGADEVGAELELGTT